MKKNISHFVGGFISDLKEYFSFWKLLFLVIIICIITWIVWSLIGVFYAVIPFHQIFRVVAIIILILCFLVSPIIGGILNAIYISFGDMAYENYKNGMHIMAAIHVAKKTFGKKVPMFIEKSCIENIKKRWDTEFVKHTK